MARLAPGSVVRCQLSVAQCVRLRPGWQAMASVFYNGELTIDHGLLSAVCGRLGDGGGDSRRGVRLGPQQFLKAQTPMTKAWAFNQYEKAWLGGPHPSSAGSGRDWLDGHHHPSPWRVENQAAAYGAGWATTAPWPPLCKGRKMIMSYRYPAGSGRSWLGDHHPPGPPFARGGK